MDREEQSDIEVIRIWPGQRERTRTMQSQQLQLGTNRGTSGAITAQTKVEAICQPINTHNPFSGMCCEYSTTSHAEMKIEKQQRSHRHNGNEASAPPFKLVRLSLENMILSQTDIVWESYIAAAYQTKVSDGRLHYIDVSAVDTRKSPSILLIQNERQFCTRHYRSVAAQSSCRPCSKQSIHAMKDVGDWERGVKIDNQRPCKRKLSGALIGTEEVSTKQASFSFSKSRDTPDLSMHVRERKNFSRSKTFFGCFENSDKCIEFDQTTETGSTHLCNFANRYPEKQSYSEETNLSLGNVNTPQICDCTGDGSEICSVKCSLASVLKDSFLGEIDVLTSNFIPETDRTADYYVPYVSVTQTGHCKARIDSEESLFVKTSTDSSINGHDSSSLYPQMASNVIFNNGDDKPIKSQLQLLCKWASHERSACNISANALTSPLLLQKTDLSFIDEEKCHFGSTLFLSTEASFPAWLSEGGKLKKQYFLSNISSLILADSLLGISINDFVYSQSSISKVESFPQILQHLSTTYGGTAKRMEIEVTLGKETMNKSAESVHPDYKIAPKEQGFCFPLHLLGADENSEEDTPKMFTEACWMQSCPKQVFDETFDKICLDMYVGELQSDNPVQANCFLHSGKMLCQNQAITDSSVVMESDFGGCRNEFCVTTTQHCNELGMLGSDRKADKTEFQVVTAKEDIVGNFSQDSTMHDTHRCENSIENGRKQDNIYNNTSETEEHNATLKFNSSNEAINPKKLSLSMDTTNGFLSETILNVVTKEEHGNVNNLQVKGVCSFESSEKPDCNLSGANYSPEGNAAIDVTNLSSEEPVRLTLHEFEMKAQFDLVLEELKLFHLIGQSHGNPFIADDKKGIEQMCSTLVELPDILPEDLPCDPGMNGGDCGFHDKTLIQAKEQEVPQASSSASSGDEESLYSLVKEGNTAKAFSWAPSFMTHGERAVNQQTEKEVTFSHGIGRVTPLKTRSGPLRIGLSKKAKIKQLHPYLR